MPHTAIVRRLSFLAGLAISIALSPLASAQQAGPTSFPIRHANGVELNAQQTRGAGVFFQRCSLCHLAKAGSGGSKYCCVRSLAPDLGGKFNNISADQEKAFKDIILNGGPTYMPSWKYALTSDEIDDIIAYLKTLS